MTDSQQLLAGYVRTSSDAAFRELVTRYVNLVYSTALRLVGGDTHRAEDVTQTVFVDLARKARTLPEDVRLGGWLHRDTCLVAGHTMRGERRRQSRERQAVEMNVLQTNSEADFSRAAPMLDEAINELGEADRTAILLRFFEQQDFRTVGQALGSNEDAARMRVTRALEKLEDFLKRRGVRTSAASLGVVLTANVVQAAPAGLAVTICTAVALTGTTIATTTAATIKTIAMTTLQKTIITATILAAVGAGIYEARQASNLQNQLQTLRQQEASTAGEIERLTGERDDATRQLAALRGDNVRLNLNTAELLRLRGEVARLRSENRRTVSQSSAETQAPDPSQPALPSSERLARFKHALEQMPYLQIPELKLCDETNWSDAAMSSGLKTDEDYRWSFRFLRQCGEDKFARMAFPALRQYIQSNNGQFPTEVTQLQPYFKSPVDEAILQRYEIVPAKSVPGPDIWGGDWIIVSKAPVDQPDTRLGIGAEAYGHSLQFYSPAKDTQTPGHD